jgi:hypothetical protein
LPWDFCSESDRLGGRGPLVEIVWKIDLARRFGVIEMVLNGVRYLRRHAVGIDGGRHGERIGAQIIEDVERDGELITLDINFALTMDNMYKGTLKPGQIEKFTEEEVAAMKARIEERTKGLYDLYTVAEKTSI